MKKILLIAACAIVGLVVLAGLWLWLFFDANQFRPRLEAAMGGAVGRKVVLGKIHLAPFSGSVAIDDVSIGDDPRFGVAPFVTAKSVSVGVDLLPLITSRDLRIESFRLDEPHIRVLRSAAGAWNFASLGGEATGGSSSGGTAAVAGVLVRRIRITKGQLLVGTLGARGKERAYDDVNVDVRNLSVTTTFPFEVTAKTPGGGTLDLAGQAGPMDARDPSATPFDATVALKRVDIASTGFVDPASGLAGSLDFAGKLHSNGRSVVSTGKLIGTRVQLVPGGAPAHVPLEVDYSADYAPATERATLTKGDVHVGKATARLTGVYAVAGETPIVRMKLAGEGMPATELQSALPAIGVMLPSGASLRQGTIDADLDVEGPVDRLVIAGPVALSNAVMTGFDLGAKLGAISALAGLPQSGATNIQTLSCALRVAPKETRVDNILLVAPSIGTLTGAGTISPKGALALSMLAKPAATGGAAESVARVASLGQPANGVPFRIQGTTASPVFVPDVGRAVTNVLKSEETKKKATDFLGRLLGRKKQ